MYLFTYVDTPFSSALKADFVAGTNTSYLL